MAALLAALVPLTACSGPPNGTSVPSAGTEVSAGPPSQEPSTPSGTTGLGILGIYTRHLIASFAFYRLLGLDVPTAPDPRAEDFRLRRWSALLHRQPAGTHPVPDLRYWVETEVDGCTLSIRPQ